MEAWRNPRSGAALSGRLRSVEPFTGFRITVLEGTGTLSPHSPLCEVEYYFDDRGALIAKVDA